MSMKLIKPFLKWKLFSEENKEKTRFRIHYVQLHFLSFWCAES